MQKLQKERTPKLKRLVGFRMSRNGKLEERKHKDSYL